VPSLRNALVLVAGTIVLSVALAGNSPAAGSAVSWTAAKDPFRLTFLVHGRPRVSEALPAAGTVGGRLGYRLQDGSFHALGAVLGTSSAGRGTAYRVATDEPGRTALVTVTPTATGAAVRLSLQPATGVAETTEAFAGAVGEHFLGGGERQTAQDLTGQSLPIKVSNACSTTMPAPFFVSSRGYGVALRSSAIASLAFPGANLSDLCYEAGPEPPCRLAPGLDEAQVCAKSAVLSYDLFVGTPEQVVSDYVSSVGRPQLPPPSQFELIKWRDVVSGPAQLYQDVDELHALGVPIGWELLDNPWEPNGCFGEMTFDPAFGDPRALIQSIHARGVKFMLWISPAVRDDGCPPSTLYPAGALLGSGGSSQAIDLTDPAARATFESSLEHLIALGVDGFKGDRGDEIDLESLQLAGGPGVDLQNRYPLLFEQAVADAIRTAGATGRFATLFRAGSPGSAAVIPGFWGGDKPGSFRGLREAINAGLSAGIVGYAIWGSDTGGYLPTESAEVFVRWAQFSAVCPIFDVGGMGENATFWDYGSPTVGFFRDAAVLHYELFPYLYALARAAHETGVPILRPLALEYPGDPAAWQQNYEVLAGDDLLAAPVVQPAPTPTPIHLPRGSWVDLTTGARIAGPVTFTKNVPLSELPLYLRAGAVIPFAARSPAIWSKPWPVNALRMAGRGGWVYAPAAGTESASTPDFGSFWATTRGRTVDIVLRGAPRETQLLIVGTKMPAALHVDGKSVPASTTIDALQQRASGWAHTTTPFPGVVVKLAPRAGAATVELTFR